MRNAACVRRTLTLRILLTAKLFKGDHCFTSREECCEYYSRVNTVRGWNLFEEIRYIRWHLLYVWKYAVAVYTPCMPGNVFPLHLVKIAEWITFHPFSPCVTITCCTIHEHFRRPNKLVHTMVNDESKIWQTRFQLEIFTRGGTKLDIKMLREATIL